jgi:hypothetical protein
MTSFERNLLGNLWAVDRCLARNQVMNLLDISVKLEYFLLDGAERQLREISNLKVTATRTCTKILHIKLQLSITHYTASMLIYVSIALIHLSSINM